MRSVLDKLCLLAQPAIFVELVCNEFKKYYFYDLPKFAVYSHLNNNIYQFYQLKYHTNYR